MTRGDWLFLVLLVAATAGGVTAGARTLGVVAAAGGGAAVLALLWLAAAAATATGWRDADGWIDCYPHCSPLQDAVGVVLVFGALLTVALAAAALGAALTRRR